jgi:hypothetical protein
VLELTMINPSTGWFGVKDVKDKPAKESMNTLMTYGYKDIQDLSIYTLIMEENAKIYSKNWLITMELRKRMVLHLALNIME